MIKRNGIYEILRFLLAGLSTTVFSYAIYLALLLLLPYMLAYVASFAAGIVFSYFMNTYFVFSRRFSWQTFLKFPLVYAVQLAINLGLVWLSVDKFGIRKEWAPLLAVAVSIPVTFLMSRAIIKNQSIAGKGIKAD
jgi:putative flippase GtrA